MAAKAWVLAGSPAARACGTGTSELLLTLSCIDPTKLELQGGIGNPLREAGGICPWGYNGGRQVRANTRFRVFMRTDPCVRSSIADGDDLASSQLCSIVLECRLCHVN